MEIKGRVDENCTISLKTISNKQMQKFGVRICKSTVAKFLLVFHILCFKVTLRCYMGRSLVGSQASLSVLTIRSINISICGAII
ncbi:hypothetical protein HZS_7672 [Henneguya salminicola]|nr:hypothetical protein HZS_7672 [Henneguya salminicola]